MLFVTGTNVLVFFLQLGGGGGGGGALQICTHCTQGYVLKEWSQIVYSWWKCGMIGFLMNLLTW